MNFLKNSYIFLLASIVLLLASLPFLQDTFFRFHDYTHVARIVELARSLQAGHFPVHWTQNFGWGYGMPLFLFYGPFPFYIGASLTFLGISAVNAMKLTFLLTHVLAFSGMYVFMKRWGRTTALVAATAFLWAPYRALDIYVRGALSEVFALSLLPWILHFGFLLFEKRRTAALGLSLSVAALVLTHNLTAFIALPFLFALTAIQMALQNKKVLKNFTALFLAYITGFALSAFYVLPLFREKNFTIVDEITTGYFDFRIHFLYIRQFFIDSWGYEGSNYGPEDGMSFHLGWVFVILATLATLAATGKICKELLQKKSVAIIIRDQKKSIFLLCVAFGLGISLFFTLGRSEFIWEIVPLFSFLQFPWRFLLLSTFFLAILSGLALSYLKNFFWRALGTLVCGVIIIATQARFHQPKEYLSQDTSIYFTDEAGIQQILSNILYDYVPKGFNQNLHPISSQERIFVNEATASGKWNKNDPHELLLTTEATPGSTIRWNIAHFPGWKYSVNNQEINPVINADGLAEYVANESVETIGAVFSATAIRRAGNIISLLALAFWLTVAITGQKRFQKGSRGKAQNS